MSKYNKPIIILIIGITVIVLIAITVFFCTRNEKFQSSGHIIFADGSPYLDNASSSTLHLPSKGIWPLYTRDTPLKLESGISLTYGEISAVAGDFYGVIGESIGAAPTFNDAKKRFMNAYNKLAKQQGTINLKGLLESIRNDLKNIDIELRAGREPSNYLYGKSGRKALEPILENTGGATWVGIGDYSLPIPDSDNQFMGLVTQNWDHFATDEGSGNHAWKAYWVGHVIAMELAAEARGKILQPPECSGLDCVFSKIFNTPISDFTDPEKILITAYTIDAFASHFLQDHFSAGHLRTPRKQLSDYDKTLYWSDFVGSRFSMKMHDQENKLGLKVKSNACKKSLKHVDCKQWTAYGDGRMGDKVNAVNREQGRKAIQRSIDEIWNSFILGTPQIEQSTVHNLLPMPLDDPLMNTGNEIFVNDGSKYIPQKCMPEEVCLPDSIPGGNPDKLVPQHHV
jgi:hypothetical protein